MNRLWLKYRDSTMCSEPVFRDNLNLAERVRYVNGAVVECGTWRGGMLAGLAEWLGPGRLYVACDGFQGLPPAQPVDGPAALAWAAANPRGCLAAPEDVQGALARAGATQTRVVGGWFAQTLPALAAEIGPVALLRLDADWYDSTLTCLAHLFRCVVPGGLIIVDDYYVWDGCAEAIHQFLFEDHCRERIRSLGDVAYIVKGATC